MTTPIKDLLFLGTHGNVLCLRQSDGVIEHTIDLPGSGYDVVDVLPENGLLFAGCNGKVYAINMKTFSIIWKNELPGMGYGQITLMTNTNGRLAEALEGQPPVLYVGSNGNVAALDQGTGATIWKTVLKGSWYRVVSMYHSRGRLFAATNGECWMLDSLTGNVHWKNDLPGLGYGSICLTTTCLPDPRLPGDFANAAAAALGRVVEGIPVASTDGSVPVPIAPAPDVIHLGTCGTAVTVTKDTGAELGRLPLPGSGWDVVALRYENGFMFMATNGRCFGLDGSTGRVVWEAPLKGFGLGLIGITTNRVLRLEDSVPKEFEAQPVVFVGVNGRVAALDQFTGAELWRVELPSTGYNVVTLVYEQLKLFAAVNGKCFALDPFTGAFLWKNELKGMGYEHICAATIHACYFGATTPLPQIASQQDEDERNRHH